MAIKRLIVIVLASRALATPALCSRSLNAAASRAWSWIRPRRWFPGSSVKVINTATNATTTVVTSDSGAYSATNLPPGTYRIEAALEGFRSAIVEGIRLTAGATARHDVTLNLGAITESVSVVAQNTLMQTEDAKVTTNISNELIDQLPLVVGGAMRSVFDLVNTIPEAKGSGTNVVSRRRAGRRVRRDARRHFGEHEPQRRRRRNRVPDAVGRSDHGVLGGDQRLQARIRAGRRRRHHVRIQVGHQYVPGLGLQLSPQRRAGRERLLRDDERASTGRTISARPGADR